MTPAQWRTIEDLFHQALAKPTAIREAWVRDACASDSETSEQVLSMLAEDRASQEVYEMPQRIGAWRVLRRIGAGGMGEVFLASRDDATYQKVAAIKVLRVGAHTADARERFLQERQILSGLEHPHIARMLDGGSTAEGAPYLVMEYVDGNPLAEHCKELPVADRCRLFAQVCDAVAYAHQRLIVHRDLKPANILVDADGIPKLLDFGIAKLLDAELASTQTQAAFTADYASPEQLQGLPVTTATDVYALGSILFELLAGRPARSVKDGSFADLVKQVCDRDVERPSKFASDSISRDLDNIVLKAMSRHPEQRYRTAFELAEDLRCFLANRPVAARGTSWTYVASKFIRRNLAVAGLISILIAALAGSTAWSLHAAKEANRQRANAELNWERLRELNHRLLFEVQASLDGVIGATNARKTLVKTALDHFEQLRKEGGKDSALLRDLSVAYRRIGDVQGYPRESHLGDVHGAIASFRRSLELAEGLPRDWRSQLDRALTLAHLADTLQSAGLFEEALQRYAECLATVPPDEGTREQRLSRIGRLLDAHQSRARQLVRMNRMKEAREDEARARELLQQGLVIAPDYIPLIRSRITQRVQDADSFKRQRRFEEALTEASLAVEEAKHLVNRADRVSDRFSLGHAFQVRSDLLAWEKFAKQSFDGALRDIDESIEQIRLLLKEEPSSKRHHYTLSSYLTRKARILERMDRSADALSTIEEAHHLNDALTHEHPENSTFQSQSGYTAYRRASILLATGRVDEELAGFRLARRSLQRAKNAQTLSFELASLERIGDLERKNGRLDAAEQSYREGLRLFVARRSDVPSDYVAYEERVKKKVRLGSAQ